MQCRVNEMAPGSDVDDGARRAAVAPHVSRSAPGSWARHQWPQRSDAANGGQTVSVELKVARAGTNAPGMRRCNTGGGGGGMRAAEGVRGRRGVSVRAPRGCGVLRPPVAGRKALIEGKSQKDNISIKSGGRP